MRGDLRECSEDADFTIVSMCFHPEPTGSAPPITDLALWASENNLHPKVIAARPSYPVNRVFDGYRNGEKDSETWRGISIRRLRLFVSSSRGVFGRLLTEGSFSLLLALLLIFNRGRSRKIISVCPSVLSTLVVGWFRRRDSRHVVIVHDVQSGLGAALFGATFAMRVLARIEKIAFNSADHLIVMSDEMGQVLKRLGINKPIHTIPPQVDTTEITPLPLAHASRKKIVYSGVIGRKQGFEQILEVALEFQKRNRDEFFVIRGDGTMKESLKRLANEKKLRNVVFESLAPRSLISESLADAQLHLVPQLAMGQDFAVPSKLFSIMAAGRPYVATASAQSPVTHITAASAAGRVVRPGDTMAFASAIIDVLEDPEAWQKMARNGRKFAVKYMDREVLCSKIISILGLKTSAAVEADCGPVVDKATQL